MKDSFGEALGILDLKMLCSGKPMNQLISVKFYSSGKSVNFINTHIEIKFNLHNFLGRNKIEIIECKNDGFCSQPWKPEQ